MTLELKSETDKLRLQMYRRENRDFWCIVVNKKKEIYICTFIEYISLYAHVFD